MSKKGKEPVEDPKATKKEEPEKEEDPSEKQLTKAAYNVIIDLLKGLSLGILATFLVSNKKAALVSGLGFGVGQGYSDCVIGFKHNEEKEKERQKAEKQAQEEEEKRKKEEEAAAAAAAAAKGSKKK